MYNQGVNRKIRKRRTERKNFLPTLLVTILAFVVVVYLFIFMDPSSSIAIPFMLLAVGVFCVFFFSILFSNTRRGVFATIGFLSFLVLGLFGLGNLLNFLLIVGVILSADYFFR